jgi:hypothetical protein
VVQIRQMLAVIRNLLQGVTSALDDIQIHILPFGDGYAVSEHPRRIGDGYAAAVDQE